MKKLLFAFLSVVTFFCLTSPVLANATDASSVDIPTEVQAILDEVALVTEYDDQGIAHVNMDQAYELGLSDEAIMLALDINGISQDIKNNGFAEGVRRVRRVAASGLTRYGHYCGAGNLGWDVAPIDNLDWACRRHDLCWQGWGPASKECNRQFVNELKVIIANHTWTPRGRYAMAALVIFLPFSL